MQEFLKHVVWSTLEDTRPYFAHLGREVPLPEGGYAVPHFDAKGEANAAFTGLGVSTTFLQTTMFYEAFLMGMGPRRGAGGGLVLTLPMADNPLPLIGGEDIGRTALGVFKRGVEFVGRTVSLAGEHVTGAELAERFTKTLGEPVTYTPLTYDEMRAGGFPFAVETASMFEFYSEASAYFAGARDVGLVRELNPRLESLDTWLAAHRDQILALA